MEPVHPLGAAHAASMVLHDFVRSGVDEDLEWLRRGWRKPPTPPSSDEEDEVTVVYASRRRGGRLVEVPKWQGPLDTDATTQRPSRRLQADRVRGGAMDFRAEQRLEMLSNLRRLASSGAAAPQNAALVPRGSGMAGLYHDAPPAAIEREARRSLPSGSADDECTSWDAWERRWAEELRAFTTAAKEQLALAIAVDSSPPLRYPLRPRRHPRGMGRPSQSRDFRDFPHAMPPADNGSDSDDGSAWQRWRPQQQQQQQQQQ